MVASTSPGADRPVTRNTACSRELLAEIEDLFSRQARELDRKKREEMLHQIQRLVQERMVFAPIWENGFIRAFGPRVDEAGLTLIPAFPYSGPLEELRLKR